MKTSDIVMARLLCACLFGWFVTPVSAQSRSDVGVDFFEKKIRPALVEHCYPCHSANTKRKGGLSLDTRKGMLQGGESGPALVPGKPDKSLLIKAIRYLDPDVKMPPKGKLPPAVIADLEKWVTLGAPDPRVTDVAKTGTKAWDLAKSREFWSFQPPRRRTPPPVKKESWPRGAIDRFILAELEKKGLKPAADADPATLIRRASFALTGLPPTLEQVDRLLRDSSPAAFARLVDDLLASPHFGQRWGRHWLDVARFAESSGGGRSLLFHHAWRYRDYVIDSFNADKPYDRFITEQIAGDLLPFKTAEQRTANLVATNYLLLGPINYEEQDKPVLEMDVIDEQLDSLGKAFLGLTFGCARCHDHKFDPIPTRDYYALAGILKSTQTIKHANVSQWTEVPLPMSPTEELTVKKHESAVAALKEEIRLAKLAEKQAGQASGGRKPPDGTKGALKGLTPLARPSEGLEAKLKQLEANGPKRPMAMAVTDSAKIEDCHVCIRGNIHNRGPKAPRGFLQIILPGAADGPLAIPAEESGRRQLASWLASSDNPLTARVMVNRIWHHLIGAGLVRTVDNFGHAGETPSHPELLDYLALRFIEDGWSVKKLIRTIMLSRAYQMQSESGLNDAPVRNVDPNNRLLWHMNRRRLDAEEIRDLMLVVGGNLDLTTGGSTLAKDNLRERDYTFADTRRSIYTPILRNRLHELFEVFDFADPNTCLGQRNVSTVATQALYLMNSPFVIDQARRTARRLLDMPFAGEQERVNYAYRLTLGRLPSAQECKLALNFITTPGGSEAHLRAWEGLMQTLFTCIDFRYVN